MKQKTERKSQVKKEEKWIDVHNDALMIKLGIRPPHLSPRDESVWTTSDYEKRIIKACKNHFKEKCYFHSIPSKSIPVFARITVQLHKNKKFPNTTYSKEIWQHEIPNYLDKFCVTKEGNITYSVVAKYSYNGKTYNPEERPYWPGK